MNEANKKRQYERLEGSSNYDYHIAATDDHSQVVAGWSAESHLLGKDVFNEEDEKIGYVDDIIIDYQGRVTHHIVATGGFLGMGQHASAIPFEAFTFKGEPSGTETSFDLLLRGYTKEELKKLPRVGVLA